MSDSIVEAIEARLRPADAEAAGCHTEAEVEAVYLRHGIDPGTSARLARQHFAPPGPATDPEGGDIIGEAEDFDLPPAELRPPL